MEAGQVAGSDSGASVANVVTPSGVVELREQIRHGQELLAEVDTVETAALLVRQSGVAVKVVPEILKARRAERERFDLLLDAAELHLRSQRRAGELLGPLRLHRGGRPSQKLFHEETGSTMEQVFEGLPTLRELGITRKEAHRWRRLASIPEDLFESYIQEGRDRGLELTTAGALALAGRLRRGPADTDAAVPSGRMAELAEFERVRRQLARLLWLDPVALQLVLPVEDRERALADIRRLQRWLVRVEAALSEVKTAEPALALTPLQTVPTPRS